ncbi:MAG: hypothetical protein M1298_04135 [Chloroflexi bacterium]|nr:hypothetical protein [Chloroflexota bacterium]
MAVKEGESRTGDGELRRTETPPGEDTRPSRKVRVSRAAFLISALAAAGAVVTEPS